MNLQAWRPTDTPKLSCNTGDSVAKSSPGAGSAGNLSLIAEFIGPQKNLNFQFYTELHSPQKPYKKKVLSYLSVFAKEVLLRLRQEVLLSLMPELLEGSWVVTSGV